MSELLSVGLFIAAIAVYAAKAGRNIWWLTAILVMLGLFIVLNVTLLASNYFTGEGINDAVLYTLTSSMTGAGVGKYVLPGLGIAAALVAMFGGLTWVLRRKNRPHHLGYSVLALVLALLSIKTTPAYQQVVSLIKSQTRSGDSDFSAWYKVPEGNIKNPKLNLVYIYGESLERTYFDEQQFPGLAPELNALKSDSLDFSHTGQIPGMDYTIAGIVASQCGIPLFAPFEGNSSASMSSFFPKNICLGDILKASGYQNYFIQGADLRFAGKDIFLQSHGFEHMYGAQELKGMVADPNYRNNWGFYDDTVLEEAYEKFIELSKAGKRFSLFTLTVDTHHPDGFISKTCTRRGYSYEGKDNRSFGAVACSQQHIAALIEKIKASPYFRNTVIVVSSDHLAMNNTAYKYLTKQDRQNLFFVIRGDKPQAGLKAVKRNTMDNGATVLDILGGGNYIGLGRSSLSGESLSMVFTNLKEKVVEWKPDVIDLWNFPKTISRYSIDQQKNIFSYSGAHFKLPLLLKIGKGKIEPLPESEYSAPLRYQLADFKSDDRFIWADRCYKMARLWAPELALSNELCVAQGQLGGEPTVRLAGNPLDEYNVQFAEQKLDNARFKRNVSQLKADEKDIRYQADSFIFNVAGAPQSVKQFSGVSRPEAWGRWSNANTAPQVKIDYLEPLPEKFDLVLIAKAFGPNVGEPVSIKVGEQEQTITFGDQLSTVTLRFENPEGSNVLTIEPPKPQLSNEGNILGHEPRKLGVGLAELKIVPISE
ncbi:phosphatidylglycerol--membrane-oligosaccharide glycerophosphotransferase [Cedecea sp. FDAARGOS_727]|uniref:phosphatidylglycerol--membrane-oligosaccharide glycerophosphotransferase n=1 Tax=Cedecea sp. FDAARGOS_727 TaxID=2545798 RepID=UPI00143E8BA5|nr:phosphatidylglycerol--membrane-oligosaccharide glycerophosphotransferase [Cedecea sp. FDAARGOS_727]QIX96837.1 phosphatidylglycerol--membrane-oligosaccharide glycerophosphotransferase [Cedecea sp. FDAARGOS_727]